MTGEQRPRDIVERTFSFALQIVRFCREADAKPGVSRILGRQLLRAGTSVGANIEEAQAGQSQADFVSKCAIALKEARETAYWLRLLQASGEFPVERCQPLVKEAGEIARILATIIVNTKRSSRTR